MTTRRARKIASGKPPDRVEEGTEVEFERSGKRMQARSHRLVRVLEDAQLGLAAAAQDGRVGPVVDLDGVDQGGLLGSGGSPRDRPERGACGAGPRPSSCSAIASIVAALPYSGHIGLAILPRLWDESR